MEVLRNVVSALNLRGEARMLGQITARLFRAVAQALARLQALDEVSELEAD